MELIKRLKSELSVAWEQVWLARTDEERSWARKRAIAIYHQIKAQERMLQAMDS